MNFQQEYFGSELALPRLVEWFNAQPVNDRKVLPGELFIIRVKVLENSSGEPEFVVGNDPTTNDPSRVFVGESVYLWVAGAGDALVATETSFYELSKFLPTASAINITGFNGTIFVEGAAEIIRRMGYGYNFDSDNLGENGQTLGLTADGTMEVRSDIDYYIDIETSLKFKTVISGGHNWAAGLTNDGKVYSWGGYSPVVPNHALPEPQLISGSLVVKQIAPLYSALVMLLADGTLESYGSMVDTPDAGTQSSTDYGELGPLSEFTDVADIRGHASKVSEWRVDLGELHIDYEQWLYILKNDGSIVIWGSHTPQDGWNNGGVDNSDLTDFVGMHIDVDNIPAVDIQGGRQTVVTLLENGMVNIYGPDITLDNGLANSEEEDPIWPGNGNIKMIAVSGKGDIAVVKTDGEFWHIYAEENVWRNPWGNIELISAGYDYFIAVDNQISVYTTDGTEEMDVTLPSMPTAIQGGIDDNCARLADGSLYWWPNAVSM